MAYKRKRISSYPFGIILPDGFDDGDLKAITEICARRSYKNVLLLISPLMYDSITAAFASQLNGEQSVQVHFKTVESLFFGGNIEAGGLLTVSDYLWAVREFLHTQQAPEAIFLPSGLPAWGRDLCGRTFLELERETGIPLEMVNTSKVVY